MHEVVACIQLSKGGAYRRFEEASVSRRGTPGEPASRNEKESYNSFSLLPKNRKSNSNLLHFSRIRLRFFPFSFIGRPKLFFRRMLFSFLIVSFRVIYLFSSYLLPCPAGHHPDWQPRAVFYVCGYDWGPIG